MPKTPLLKTVGFVLALIVTAMLVFSGFDAQDEQLEDTIYCSNVHDGVWPDYEERYERDCKDGMIKSTE